MLIIYGAGNNFVEFIKEYMDAAIPENERMIMDSYPEKYPNGVLGYRVYGAEKLKEMSSNDYLYITSTDYHDEILDFIKKINTDIKICNKHIASWIWCNKRKLIQEFVAKEDNYTLKINVEEWMNSALNAELKHWDCSIPKMIEKSSIYVSEREFVYGMDEKLSFTEQDVILDAGCGPLPRYGNVINGKKIKYIPVDPLAYQYRDLLKNNNVTLPVEPGFAIMELLTSFYKENSIDYVIIDNALDHCIDIFRALIECFNVLKIGGHLLLAHKEAEGLYEKYSGLHKYNIVSEGSDLIFFNADSFKLNVSEMFSPYADIEVKRKANGCRDIIYAKIRKEKNLPQSVVEKYDDKMLAGKMIDNLFRRLLDRKNQ